MRRRVIRCVLGSSRAGLEKPSHSASKAWPALLGGPGPLELLELPRQVVSEWREDGGTVQVKPGCRSEKLRSVHAPQSWDTKLEYELERE